MFFWKKNTRKAFVFGRIESLHFTWCHARVWFAHAQYSPTDSTTGEAIISVKFPFHPVSEIFKACRVGLDNAKFWQVIVTAIFLWWKNGMFLMFLSNSLYMMYTDSKYFCDIVSSLITTFFSSYLRIIEEGNRFQAVVSKLNYPYDTLAIETRAL